MNRLNILTLIFCVCLITVSGCEDSPTDQGPPPAPVTTADLLLLDKLTMSTLVGGTEDITVSARTTAGGIDTLTTVTSNDEGVVTTSFIV